MYNIACFTIADTAGCFIVVLRYDWKSVVSIAHARVSFNQTWPSVNFNHWYMLTLVLFGFLYILFGCFGCRQKSVTDLASAEY